VQVYLQSAQGDDQSWNAKFSSMMVKVLQDSYIGSPLCKQNLARSDVLIEQAAPRKPPPKVSNPFLCIKSSCDSSARPTGLL